MSFTSWTSKIPIVLTTSISDMMTFKDVKDQLEKVVRDIDDIFRDISNRALDKSGDKISGDITLGNLYLTGNVGVQVESPDGIYQVKDRIRFNTTNNCTFVGYLAGDAFVQANNALGNTGVGDIALTDITTGDYNTAMGYYALTVVTTGGYNTGIGYQAGLTLAAQNYNTAVGAMSLRSGTPGSSNVAVGYQAMQGGASTSANENNVGVGYQALNANTTADVNVAVGYQALLLTTTGGGNVAVGGNAGHSLTTGTFNTFIGRNAGYHASQKVDVTNSIAIGYGAYTDADNQMVLGNATTLTCVIYGAITFPTGLGAHTHTSAATGGDYPWADFVAADVTYLQALVADITQTNLVDKSATEAITGQWTFDNFVTRFHDDYAVPSLSTSFRHTQFGGNVLMVDDNVPRLWLLANAFLNASSVYNSFATGTASWRLTMNTDGDVFSIDRAPAAVGTITFATLLNMASTGVLTLSSLAGVGVRAVVAAADGTLSAP